MKTAAKYLFFSILLSVFLILPPKAHANVIAQQTSSWDWQINVWAASQDLGSNLSGKAGHFTFRTLDTPIATDQFDFTARNTKIYDKSNNYSFIAGCVNGTQRTDGLTITKTAVPAGYQDVTIDYSCRDYNFITGHSYLINIVNANSCAGCLKLSGHGNSDGHDYFPNGGLLYTYDNQFCFSNIQNYQTSCHILATPQDDLYFKLETINPPPTRTPLIFIPGIGGSELKVAEDTNWSQPDGHGGIFSHNYKTNDLAWINPLQAALPGNDDYFDVLRLKNDGQTSEANIQLTGNLFNGAYQPTLDFFTASGYTLNQDLFIFPYDWRKDLSLTKPLLDQKIDSIIQQTGTQKVDIVAHSMGGLVARNYISDPTKAQKVRKLVELGTPHLGSVKIVKALNYGDCLYLQVGSTCLTLNQQELKDVIQNYPGAFELAPTQKYFTFYSGVNENHPLPFRDDRDIDNNSVTGPLNYLQTKNLLTNLGLNTNLFLPSETFHDIDNSLDITNGVDVSIISGSGINTIGQIIENYKTDFFGNKKPEKDMLLINGDNTVPLFSSALVDKSTNISLNGNANDFYTNQTHGDLPGNGPALVLTKSILNGGDTIIPPGASTDPYQVTGKLISLHSPVNIHVYDSNGNHTGPTPDGDFETNIPGSTYQTLDDAKFVFLPNDGIYSIKLEATDQGSFDFKIRDYKNNNITQTTLYKDIPLEKTTNGTAILDTKSTQSPILHIDENGDGQNDADLNPTSNLTGSANFDQTAPKSSVELTGTLGSNNWYRSDVKVEITSQDEQNGSGISKTEYSTDGGQTVNLYSGPFTISTEGITKLQFKSEDLAGNEEIPQQIEIKVDKTPPEAKIFIDQDKQDLVVTGIDDNPTTITRSDNTATKKKDDAIYLITDLAGNTLKLDVRDRDKEKQDRFGIFALTYNQNTPILEPSNHYNVSYNGKKDKLDVSEENFEIKNDVKVRIQFNEKKNKSTIITKESGLEKIKEIKNGLILLKLTTDKGTLETIY